MYEKTNKKKQNLHISIIKEKIKKRLFSFPKRKTKGKLYLKRHPALRFEKHPDRHTYSILRCYCVLTYKWPHNDQLLDCPYDLRRQLDHKKD